MVNLYSKDFELDNIVAVLFDKDGTFLDDHLYWGKLAEMRIKYIIEYFSMDKNLLEELCFSIGYNHKTTKLIKNGAIGVLSRDEVIEYMVKDLQKYKIFTDFNTISNIFDNVHKSFLQNIDKYVKFIKHSEDFIKTLKEKDIKLGVVTSDTSEHTKEILKILNISNCFDVVIGRDDCRRPKRTGEPALLAIEKLNTKREQTIVIGDAPMDGEMAHSAGLKASILVATGQTDIEDLKKYSNNVVNNLKEVKIK